MISIFAVANGSILIFLLSVGTWPRIIATLTTVPFALQLLPHEKKRFLKIYLE
jgi:hypothetical protein